MKAAVWAVAERFVLDGPVKAIVAYGNGLINDTYLATTDSVQGTRVIIQRINRRVFPRPAWVMANIEMLIDHVERQNRRLPGSKRTLCLPTLYKSADGASHVVDAEGDVWRALAFIENTCTLEAIESLSDAEQVGFALGRFHRLVHELDVERLHDTLPGFHIAPHYFQRYVQVSAKSNRTATSTLRACFKFMDARKRRVVVLEEAKRTGALRVRPTHGDPKLNNILFHEQTRRAVSIIDLDTVKPGLIHYDIGDCLRSCSNTAGESPDSAGTVDFDLGMCCAILRGYCAEMHPSMTNHDYSFLYDAIHLIPLELGLRFLTDYLEGNRYFKVDDPEQNLLRAQTQFQLVASIERQQEGIKKIIAELAATERRAFRR
jgi:Ser/Thr protein kinase RdoA (MazF antagonist)